jgi:hypothetical protein
MSSRSSKRFALPLAVLVAACDRPPQSAEPRDRVDASVTPPDAALSRATEEQGGGELPVDFPPIGTDAKAGDFVLAPSKSWLDEATAHGADKQPFIFYGAWVEQPGAKESSLRTLPGQKVRIPNALVILVGRGESASVGDVVLTAWASGSGMQRAIVVPGGAALRPQARYLDLDLDSPTGWGSKADTLKADTFRVLKRPGEPGTTVACKDGPRTTRWIVVSEHEDKILGVGFAGKLNVLSRATCVNVPIVPQVKVRDTVWVPVIGAYTRGIVTKLDATIGRVWVKHEFGGVEKEEAFAFTEVAKEL